MVSLSTLSYSRNWIVPKEILYMVILMTTHVPPSRVPAILVGFALFATNGVLRQAIPRSQVGRKTQADKHIIVF